MSDGNLITHLRSLHQAGYVAYRKEILTRPQTRYELTVKGTESFSELSSRAGRDGPQHKTMIFLTNNFAKQS